MVPALGLPSHFRRCRFHRPRRRPRRRWGFNAGEKTRRLCRQMTRVVRSSPSRRSGRQQSGVITNLALGDVAIAGPGVEHTPSKTAAFRSSPLSSSTPHLFQAPLACAIGYTHIEIICLQNCVNLGVDCDVIGEIIGEIMDVIIYDIINL